MDIKHSIFALAVTLGAASQAIAFEVRPVIALQGGYASLNSNHNLQTYVGTDSNMYTYDNSNRTKNTSFFGTFLGVEHTIPWSGYFMQAGVEYNDFDSVRISGINTAGPDADTASTYSYKYNFQTQQVLGVFKLFATFSERFHPYGEIGLGEAFNHTGHFYTATDDTDGLNLTPDFADRDPSKFSYILGLGVEAELTCNLRFGVGYRYSNFGSSNLGQGSLAGVTPVGFSLSNSNYYSNQFFARISYAV